MIPLDNKSTVLIVDDDDATRIHIIATGSATEALWFLEKFSNEIDILLIDILLPDSNGFILLTQSRKIVGNKPSLAISAIPPFELEMKSKIVGFDSWISKPIDIEKLKMIVNSLLN